MDIPRAKALIEQQRCRWRSQASDVAVARRAERAYLGIAIMFMFLSFSLSLLLPAVRALIFPCCFLTAAMAYWQSWRFRQVRNLLRGSDATTDSP